MEPPSRQLNCLVYVGLPSNPQFVGPQDLHDLAKHILKSRGPSGLNKEYLYLLEEALEELSEESRDEHVSDLVKLCRWLETAEYKAADGGDFSAKEEDVKSDMTMHKTSSSNEQEEVEKEV